MSTIQTPKDWEGRAVSTLDLLLFIREKVIEGSSMALQSNGLPDQEFDDFVVWLRDVKREWPEDGWVKKYLRELGGDHEAAIKKFLDFVAEFADTRKR